MSGRAASPAEVRRTRLDEGEHASEARVLGPSGLVMEETVREEHEDTRSSTR